MESLENSWRARYDRWAGQYKADHLIAGWSELGLSRRLALVLQSMRQEKIQPGGLILDLGSGPGTYTRTLGTLGYRSVGLDYSHTVARLAKERDRTGTYLQGEAYHLPFPNGSFDAVICVGVLQSLQLIDRAIAEIGRVLRPGGYVFLDGLNSFFWLHGVRSLNELLRHLPRRLKYYDPRRLTRTIEALGFSTPHVRWLAVPGSMQKIYALEKANRSRFLSVLFGHAFLIIASKPSVQPGSEPKNLP